MELDKTEFLILGTKQQLAKVNIDNIKVGSTYVTPVPVVRNLGSWFTMSKLSSVASYQVYNIRRTCKYLSQEATPCFHNVLHRLLQQPVWVAKQPAGENSENSDMAGM